jgi:hypothetical protein
MRLVTRAVTTAGVTVLGITVMAGAAHAGTAGGSPLLSGLTNAVAGTTHVVNGLAGPVSNVTAPQGMNPHMAGSARKRAPGLNVGVRVKTPAVLPVQAHARVGVKVLAVQAAADVCVGAASCGDGLPPSPPGPPVPPGEPSTPPAPSEPPAPSAPPETPPVASGEIGAPVPTAMSSRTGALPFTGAPVNTLAALGGILLLGGAAAVVSARRRADSES